MHTFAIVSTRRAKKQQGISLLFFYTVACTFFMVLATVLRTDFLRISKDNSPFSW
jgi:hypothetical protein